MLATLVIGTLFGYAFFHLSVISSDRVSDWADTGRLFIARHLGQLDPARWTAGDTVMLWFLGAMVFTHLSRRLASGRRGASQPASFSFISFPPPSYWVARRTPTNPKQLRGMFAVFAALGFYLAITAIAEKLEIRGLIFPRYIADPEHMEFLGRARGPLLNPSAKRSHPDSGARREHAPRSPCRTRRSATDGFVGRSSLGRYRVYFDALRLDGRCRHLRDDHLRRTSKRFRFSFLLMVVGCGGCFLAAKSQSFSSFKRDKNVSVADMRESARLRPILATIAWQMFLDRPWFGCGTARYTETAKDYLPSEASICRWKRLVTTFSTISFWCC